MSDNRIKRIIEIEEQLRQYLISLDTLIYKFDKLGNFNQYRKEIHEVFKLNRELERLCDEVKFDAEITIKEFDYIIYYFEK